MAGASSFPQNALRWRFAGALCGHRRVPAKALLLWDKGRTDLKANFWYLPKWAIKVVFWRRVVARINEQISYFSNKLQIIQIYCKTMSKVIYYRKQMKGNWRAVGPLCWSHMDFGKEVTLMGLNTLLKVVVFVVIFITIVSIKAIWPPLVPE